MNVILIVSDTLRYDYLGCYGNKRIKTPNLDLFSDNSTVFNKAYLASFPTIPHRHDVFSGRFTFTYSGWSPIPRNETVLAEILRRNGCVTQLIADTPHMFKNGFNFDRGFCGWSWIRGQEDDRFMTSPRKVDLPCKSSKLRRSGSVVGRYLRNTSERKFESDYFVAQTMTKAIEWLELNYDKHDKWFLHVDTFDPHEPWDPPRWYVDMYDPDYKGEEVTYPDYRTCEYLKPEELEHCRALYAGEVTLVDRWVGMLLQKIQDLGLTDNTAIIFTSDHGFYLGEHGFIGKLILTPMTFGFFPLYEEVAHLPLIVFLPGEKRLKNSEALVQPPDLTPTILDLFDIEHPSSIRGESLLPILRGQEVDWRSFAVSSPSLVEGMLSHPSSGQRITITTDKWAFIYPGQIKEIIKDNPDRLSNFSNIEKMTGKATNELYDLSRDSQQKCNLFDEKKDVAGYLCSQLAEFLKNMGTPKDQLKYWTSIES